MSDDPAAARLVDMAATVPPLVWGCDGVGAGEIGNSNWVIGWLVARDGLFEESIQPPAGGRAPGWGVGVHAVIGRCLTP